MPLNPNFSCSQSMASNNELTFVDTSTGSDGTITQRRIYILDAYGNYLVESGTTTDYETWAYPIGTNITLDVLEAATTPQITVQWLAGTTVVYTKTINFCFDLQLYTGLIGLTRGQISKPSIVQDTNYYGNKIQLMVNAKDSENSITYGNNIITAQNAADMGQEMVNNQTKYF